MRLKTRVMHGGSIFAVNAADYTVYCTNNNNNNYFKFAVLVKVVFKCGFTSYSTSPDLLPPMLCINWRIGLAMQD